MIKIILTTNEIETKKLAQKLADILPSGSVLCLYGDLGAGKTTFVRGLAIGLNILETIQSPTFNIMKLYFKGNRPLIHIDAYRLKDINNDIGLEEYIGYESGITVIEWPEFIKKYIPKDKIEIQIANLGDNNREIKISSNREDLISKL